MAVDVGGKTEAFGSLMEISTSGSNDSEVRHRRHSVASLNQSPENQQAVVDTVILLPVYHHKGLFILFSHFRLLVFPFLFWMINIAPRLASRTKINAKYKCNLVF